MRSKTFSQDLNEWLASDSPKTLQSLINNFAEKSFAVLMVVLMAIPALPLPTGGATHIFEAATMLLALEIVAGVRKVWLPAKWANTKLPAKLKSSTLPLLARLIHRVEKFSRVRLHRVLTNTIGLRLTGLAIFVLTLFAFLAPPFSGLDTLPALGVVIIALGIIMDDFVFLLIGLIVGLVGVGLVISAGKILINLL